MEDYKVNFEKLIQRIYDLTVNGCIDEKVAKAILKDFTVESDDERIRKALIQHIKNKVSVISGWRKEELIAWLEKQGELVNSLSKGLDNAHERIDELIQKNNSLIKQLENQGEPQDKGEISDGYHTFNELYYYRMLYNAAFFNMLPKEWVHKSKKHHDGEECFGGGWFIVMANLPTGQISNHYELKDWDLFQIPEKEVADKWDGHTPQEAAERLHKYLLEKQDEQKSVIEGTFVNVDKVREDFMKEVYRVLDADPTNDRANQIIDAFDQLPTIIIQKPTDKVEPKFKVGDWIINSKGMLRHIVDVDKTGYQTDKGWLTHEDYEKEFHLWTIQDAKDGDVLVFDDSFILIFKEIVDFNTPLLKNIKCFQFKSYINLDFLMNVFEQGNFCDDNGNKCYPATKEQRDLLFQKMKEAGYEWDVEKKELKKIEKHSTEAQNEEELSDFEYALLSAFSDGWQQYLLGEGVDVAQWAKEHSAELLEAAKQNSTEWTEEDENNYTTILKSIRNTVTSTKLANRLALWLKSLRPQPKQEWNEKDEKMLDKLRKHFDWGSGYYLDRNDYDDADDWLISIKERMKGE